MWGKQLLHTLNAQASSPEWRGNSPRGGLAPRCRSSRPHRPRREGGRGKGGVRERPLGGGREGAEGAAAPAAVAGVPIR